MVFAACVSVFVVLFILDHVDLVFVVAFNIVIRGAAVKEISKEEGSNRLAPSSTGSKHFETEVVWASSSECSR